MEKELSERSGAVHNVRRQQIAGNKRKTKRALQHVCSRDKDTHWVLKRAGGQVGRWVSGSGSVYMTVRLYGYMAVWHNGRQQKSWRVPATSSLNKLFIRNVCRTKMATDASSNFFHFFTHTHTSRRTHTQTY